MDKKLYEMIQEATFLSEQTDGWSKKSQQLADKSVKAAQQAVDAAKMAEAHSSKLHKLMYNMREHAAKLASVDYKG